MTKDTIKSGLKDLDCVENVQFMPAYENYMFNVLINDAEFGMTRELHDFLNENNMGIIDFADIRTVENDGYMRVYAKVF